MSAFLIAALLTVAVLIGIGLYRVWIGPTVFDRLVAVALVSVNGVIVIVLLGVVLERPVLFFDIALGFALLAFLLPITLGRYFEARLGMRDSGAVDPPEPQHEIPHTRLADRGRELERRYAERLRRQASDANVATSTWSRGTRASAATRDADAPEDGSPMPPDDADTADPNDPDGGREPGSGGESAS